jgi:hypothetical protein
VKRYETGSTNGTRLAAQRALDGGKDTANQYAITLVRASLLGPHFLSDGVSPSEIGYFCRLRKGMKQAVQTERV